MKKKIFFYFIFSKYCKLEEIVHPSSLPGCSGPTERLFWCKFVYIQFICGLKDFLLFVFTVCFGNSWLSFHLGTFERFANKHNWWHSKTWETCWACLQNVFFVCVLWFLLGIIQWFAFKYYRILLNVLYMFRNWSFC